MGYLEGNATKYVSRWRKKGGVADLEKALHYIDKLLESNLRSESECWYTQEWLSKEVQRFCEINNLDGIENTIILMLADWDYDQSDRVEQLEAAKSWIHVLINEPPEIEKAMAELADPKPVPLTEENHHAERATKD
jgi:hypothetical protein